MKTIIPLLLLWCPTFLHGQVRVYDEPEIEKQVRIHMRPLIHYSGKWKVLVKEWSKGRDTILLKGTSESRVAINENVRDDSASINFDFKWESPFTSGLTDISSIKLSYDSRENRYNTMITQEPKNGHWIANFYTTANGEFANPLIFYRENSKITRKPKVFCKWTFGNARLSLQLHEHRLDNKVRMRIFEFYQN